MGPPGSAVEVKGKRLLSGCGGDDEEQHKNKQTLGHSMHSESGLRKMRIAGSGARVTDNEQTQGRKGHRYRQHRIIVSCRKGSLFRPSRLRSLLEGSERGVS